MKKKTVLAVLSLLMLFGVISPYAIAAEENPSELKIMMEGQEEPLIILNQSDIDIQSVNVEKKEEESAIDLVFASADGTLYEFTDVNYEDMIDPVFVEEEVFAFIKYTGATSGKERSIGQTGEILYREPAELFAIDDVYIRRLPDSESEITGLIYRGDAISVLGETAKYYMVQKEDVTGYTVKKCISKEEQEAIAAVKAQEAAVAAQEAAAAAASAAQSSGSGGVREVSRERFDDCDGSGHGYFVIHYSDGSKKKKNY